MNHRTHEKIIRMKRQGWLAWAIAEECGVSQQEVRAVLHPPAKSPTRLMCERRRLLASGADPAAVAAAFGE